MDSTLRELLDLVIRWTHVVAGILWIGNSMLFNWLDRNLEKAAPGEEDPRFEGRIWLVHSGGFYEVVKKQLAPSQVPAALHWFKWQNFSSWLSGILLLIVVYYLGGGAYLVDPAVSRIGVGAAIALGAASIVLAWGAYDGIWRSPLGRRTPLAAALCFALACALAFGLSHVLSGRAAYMHVGVAIGTIMTGNVWMVILPSQRELLAATRAGRAQDPALAWRAKQRSIHNNYMTYPLLFIMVSHHFPSTYATRHGWLVLAVVAAGGALVRHFMNIRFTAPQWGWGVAATVTVTLVVLVILTRPKDARPTRVEGGAAVASFRPVRAVIAARCNPCHSATPTDDVWKVAPSGVMLDTPEQIKNLAPRIKERACVTRSMPLANKTGITDDERDLLAAWVDQGATIPPAM